LPKVTLPFKVEISRHDIGGPSAGLMTRWRSTR
jgi:PDZ domain-containing secreted protein